MLTLRQTFARYISDQLQRAAHFRNPATLMHSERRANDIRTALAKYVRDTAPSGSGIDAGIHLLPGQDMPRRLVFACDFHHMDEHGGYSGWTNHTAVVTPTFSGIDVRITGRDRNQIKDHLGELIHGWLTSEANHPALIEGA